MEINGSTALVTGANRGLGLAFVRALKARGAAKIYAAARDPASVTEPGVIPIRLDVTKPEEIAAAAREIGDVTLLINNAGIARPGPFLAADAIARATEELEVNYFGPLRMAQAFAPTLGRNGGGAILNVLSVASWINGAMLATYGASKSAAWALTNGLRHELAEQGTQVVGLHAGFIDTDLTQGIDLPKSTPEAIVTAALDTLEAGGVQALTDEISQKVHAGLSAETPSYILSPAALRGE